MQTAKLVIVRGAKLIPLVSSTSLADRSKGARFASKSFPGVSSEAITDGARAGSTKVRAIPWSRPGM